MHSYNQFIGKNWIDREHRFCFQGLGETPGVHVPRGETDGGSIYSDPPTVDNKKVETGKKDEETESDVDPRDALKDLRQILKLPGSKERKISALRGFIGRRTNELNLFIDRQRFRLQQTNWQMTKGEHGRFTNQIKSAQRDIFTAQSHLFHLSGGQYGKQTTLGPQSPNDRSDEERESSQASINRNIALNKAYKAKEELNLRVQNHASRQVRNYIEESLPTNSPLRGPDGKVHIPSQLQEKMDRSKRKRAALDAAPNGIISRDVLGTSAIADYSDAQIYRSVQAKHAQDNAAMNQRGRDIEANRAVAENNAYVEQVRALGESVQYPALGKTFAKNPTMMKVLSSLHAVHMKLVEDANKGALVAMPQSSQGRIEDMRLAIQAVQALASSPALLAVHQQNMQNNPRPTGYLTALGSQIRSGEVVVEKAVDSTSGAVTTGAGIVADSAASVKKNNSTTKKAAKSETPPASTEPHEPSYQPATSANTLDSEEPAVTTSPAVSRTRQAARDYADRLSDNSFRYDAGQRKDGAQMLDALNRLADDDDRQSALLESANIQNESGPVLRELSVDMPGTNPYSAITITVPDNLSKFRNNKITYQPNKSPPIDNYSIDTLRNAGIILESEAMSSGKIGAVNVKFTKPGTYIIDTADAFTSKQERMQPVYVLPEGDTLLMNEAKTSEQVKDRWGLLESGSQYTREGTKYFFNYYFDTARQTLFAHSALPDTYYAYSMPKQQWVRVPAPAAQVQEAAAVDSGASEKPDTELASLRMETKNDAKKLEKMTEAVTTKKDTIDPAKLDALLDAVTALKEKMDNTAARIEVLEKRQTN
ncbi:MAG: hypothetical protein KBD00_01955 [Candidatus Peribacteraceae bacterium]|nr:hypothetical protein [Candidatus Peribacteraceae bacterium]